MIILRLATIIKNKRLELRLTQKELSQKAGVSQQYISYVENLNTGGFAGHIKLEKILNNLELKVY